MNKSIVYTLICVLAYSTFNSALIAGDAPLRWVMKGIRPNTAAARKKAALENIQKAAALQRLALYDSAQVAEDAQPTWLRISPLTPEELETHEKEKRKRNMLSARASRANKKINRELLADTLAGLKALKYALETKITQLTEENAVLREEIGKHLHSLPPISSFIVGPMSREHDQSGQ